MGVLNESDSHVGSVAPVHSTAASLPPAALTLEPMPMRDTPWHAARDWLLAAAVIAAVYLWLPVA